MSSLTIRGLGKTLMTRLEARAIDEGVSVNQLVKTLLERSLGVKSSNNRQHFAKFLGTWSEAEMREFEKATADFAT